MKISKSLIALGISTGAVLTANAAFAQSLDTAEKVINFSGTAQKICTVEEGSNFGTYIEQPLSAEGFVTRLAAGASPEFNCNFDSVGVTLTQNSFTLPDDNNIPDAFMPTTKGTISIETGTATGGAASQSISGNGNSPILSATTDNYKLVVKVNADILAAETSGEADRIPAGEYASQYTVTVAPN